MSRTPMICFFFSLLPLQAHAQEFSTWVSDNKSVVISSHGESIELLGVDLKSAGGHLIPVSNNDASPFSFLLTNNPNQITYGSLSDTVDLQGELVLTARYAESPETFVTDVTGEWGSVVDGGGIAAQVAAPVLPEPYAGTILLQAMGVLFLLRQRRR